jgi:ferrous-iron efflux pump FieF
MNIPNPYLHGESGETVAETRLKRMAATASIGVGVILITIKLAAFWLTNAVSILSSLMDSFFDVLASSVAMMSIVHAATPADRNHRFGHGKLEALGALGQAIFILGSSILLLVESVRRFITPEPVTAPGIGMVVIVISLFLTAGLILFQRHVIKKTKSVALSADHLHYKGDIMMNFSVLAAIGLSAYTGWSYFDPIFAIGISLTLLFGAYKIGKESADILMDKELPREEREKIKALVLAHRDVASIHDLRTRSTGERVFIEFHLEMDGGMTLSRAHDITEELEVVLYKAFPKAEIMMHQEPAGIDDARIDHLIAASVKKQ